MKIQQETLDALKAQGIIVSPFPTDEAEAKDRAQAREDYEACYRYVSTTTRYDMTQCKWVTEHGAEVSGWEQRVEKAMESWYRPCSFMGAWYNATEVYIRKGDMLFKRTVQKGKLYDEEWVLGVVAREEKAYSGAYGQFAKDVQKMFADKMGGIGFIYPTTYGIGVWVFYNWKSNECIDRVREVLDGMGIEYSNEFSDAKFVYRFKISKKEVNRKKLSA